MEMWPSTELRRREEGDFEENLPWHLDFESFRLLPLPLIWRTVVRWILEKKLGYFVKGNVLPIHTRPCLPCCEDICFPGCVSPHRSTTNQFVACSVSQRASVPILELGSNTDPQRTRVKGTHLPYTLYTCINGEKSSCDDVTSSWPRFFLPRG